MERFLAFRRLFGATLVFFLATAQALAGEPAQQVNPEFRLWIEDMKEAERGPFQRIRWFCRDGSILPPGPHACSQHGGGHQHGELNERARRLREDGFWIANILAGRNVKAWADSDDFMDRYAQLLTERFLVRADNGWIMRRALFYRGAIQEQDERAAAYELLLELAGRDEWIGYRFPALRAGVNLLPHGEDSASVLKLRQAAAALSDRDPGFRPLRIKIHGAPGPEDAETVRRYARGLEKGEQAAYLALADEIDAVYQAAPVHETLSEMAEPYTAAPWLQDRLRAAAAELRLTTTPQQSFRATAQLLHDLREALPRVNAASARLDLVELGLRLEEEHFRAAAEVRKHLQALSRLQQIRLLGHAARAAYGTGLINERLLGETLETVAELDSRTVSLARYRSALDYLARAPGWASQALRMHFFESMRKLAQIEPMAMLFIQDQLRGSPLLFYSQVLDGLSRDAHRLAGVNHRLFGREVGVGFNALNPGLARGVLDVEPDLSRISAFRPDGIYVLPETVSDLPPVAAILTAGEGNPLSHVQLLARNLGIPNVTVSVERIEELAAHDGEEIVMAVSRAGLVEITAWEGRWSEVFAEQEATGGVVIRPDLDKLDLSLRQFVPLDELRATDSGRIVGPKAAKLGELHRHYPEQVSRGVAIPFGLFRQEALERVRPGHDETVWKWMTATYDTLETMPQGSEERDRASEAFRLELYQTLLDTPLDDDFRSELQAGLAAVFGEDGVPGLYVRSDTNIEDLAGFTGAGLNLTLPNVVGMDSLLEAIARVWASPFTARAFAWRQSRMTAPEHVYTSVLLLETVASDKSGVLVTQDIDTGNDRVISVAVNEGLGGAVDGQAAESLRIDLDTGEVTVLAAATAPWRRMPNPAGGLALLPVSGDPTVLKPAEIGRLAEFARGLPARFPPIRDDEGRPVPADVEFGFVDGRLRLFQLRPFLDSRSAAGSRYLLKMDASLGGVSDIMVEMESMP